MTQQKPLTAFKVIFPADRNGVVGIKPTPGLTSREGVIPESTTQDTVGTFGRTVADAAILLEAIVDPTKRNMLSGDIVGNLAKKGSLKGARFGLPQRRVWEAAKQRGSSSGAYEVFDTALESLRQAGAELIEVEIPSAGQIIPPNGWDW